MRRSAFLPLFVFAPTLAGCAVRSVTLPPRIIEEREYLTLPFSYDADHFKRPPGQKGPRARIFMWGACEDEQVCRAWMRHYGLSYDDRVSVDVVVAPEGRGKTTVVIRVEDVRTGLLDEERLELTVTPSADLHPLEIRGPMDGQQMLLLREAPEVFRTQKGLPSARCALADAEIIERDLPIRASVDRARIRYFRCRVANEIEPGQFYFPSSTTERLPQREVDAEFVACVLATHGISAAAIQFVVTDPKGWRVLPEGLGPTDPPVCRVLTAQRAAP